MMNWDDLRIVQAVAKKRSVRKAATELGVHHTTISRRIEAFEQEIGVRVFNRNHRGYLPTEAGEELLKSVDRIEEEVNDAERRLLGRDLKLSGEIRVTVAPSLAAHFLMPILTDFMNHYPDVDVEIIATFERANLNKREADIAFRVTNDPPEYLVGRKLAEYHVAAYATTQYLADHDLQNDPSSANWIGWDDYERHPGWVKKSAYPQMPIRGRINNDFLQCQAAKANMGVAVLGCFIGDSEPQLVRVPPGISEPRMSIWLLTHKDLLSSVRFRVFMDWIAQAFQKHKDLFEGRCPQHS